MADFTSAAVGAGFASSRALALINMPGMQNPHCTAPTSPKAHAYTSRSRAERPSLVVTDLPWTLATVSVQARTAFPFTITEQEPQTPSAQPSFTEVRRASSRRYSSRFLSASTATSFPFSVNWNIPLAPQQQRLAAGRKSSGRTPAPLRTAHPRSSGCAWNREIPWCSRTSASRFPSA